MAQLTRYNPFNEVVSLRDAMDRLFADSFISPSSSQFAVRGTGANLYETGEGYMLQIPMPGVKAEAVDITIQQESVVLKWETKIQAPEGATALWQGFQSGQFQQAYTLPAPVNAERAEAHYNDGILTLSLPKAEHAKARTVKVNAVK